MSMDLNRYNHHDEISDLLRITYTLNSSGEDGIVVEKRSGRLCFWISTLSNMATRNPKTTAIGSTIRQRSGCYIAKVVMIR